MVSRAGTFIHLLSVDFPTEQNPESHSIRDEEFEKKKRKFDRIVDHRACEDEMREIRCQLKKVSRNFSHSPKITMENKGFKHFGRK